MYDALTIISEGVKNTINSRVSKQYILPLGADIISFSPKTYETLNIIYVGTLDNRDIYKTIEGIYLFQLANPDVSLHYDIIGDGEEYRLLEEYIKKYSLELTVSLHGWVPNSKIKPFIEKASYGVAFVPINPYYEDQPSTKIYEYALSGIYVIATNTRSNREIINAKNGILIEDTPIAVKNALEYIVLHKNNINESSVRESLKEYLWKDIVDKKLKPIIDLL
jgi:glycosyltransferase involved in cell wall biosynthesis